MSEETLYAFRRNLVVAASAGTGKTHSLVGVLLHLLLGASELGQRGRLRDPVDPSRLVATTFSRKAAAEIRARLVEELEGLAGGAEGRYGALFVEARRRCGEAPWSAAERARRARIALERVGQAQIGTLHSLAASLVRKHALEIGLAPGFELADEDEDRRRLEGAVARALEALFAREPMTAREIADASGGVDGAVGQLAAALRRLEEDGRDVLSLELDASDGERVERTMSELLACARALAADAKLGPPAQDLLSAWTSGDPQQLESAAAVLAGVAATGKKTPEAARFFALRATLPGTKNAERGRRLAHLWRVRARLSTVPASVRALLAEADAERRRKVQEKGTLGFGDVLRVARDLLRDRPDVAARVARDLDVLMVDEFQDTSRLQRDLVSLLWTREEARAEGVVPALGALRPNGLFVVGDRKQSIYGFRGADVGVFAELCVALAGEAARTGLGIPAGVTWEPDRPSADFLSLRHNRRGAPSLLTFANHFSRRLLRPTGPPPVLYEIDYVPETEDLLPPPEKSAAASSDPPRTTWLRPKTKEKSSTRLQDAWATATRIRRIVEGREIAVRGEPARWRDVAVLATTNEMLDAMAFALAEANVPYVVEGRAFFASREVRDLRAMLALVVDPRDRLALLEVLRGPWAGVHDATLLALTDPHRGLSSPGEAWDAGARRVLIRPEDEAKLEAVREVVLDLHEAQARLGPADTLREAVRLLELEETLAQLPRGAQRVANVRKLLAMAEEHHDAPSLLARIDEALARDAPEADAPTFSEADDAVRLLTVHASKGLAFPIVFVPQVGALPQARGGGAILLDPGHGDAPTRLACKVTGDDGAVYEPPSYVRAVEQERRRLFAERRRLAYVAATRAEEALFWVGTREPPTSESPGWAATPAAALLDLAAADPATTALVVEDVEVGRPAPATIADKDAAVMDPPPALPAPAWRALPMAPTLLQDFHHCPRRFELLHLLGLSEPERVRRGARAAAGASAEPAEERLDAREEGTLAHAVLERIDVGAFGRADAAEETSRLLAAEGLAVDHPRHGPLVARLARFFSGPYARRIAEGDARVLREQPFVMDVVDAEGRAVVLRGTIDLLVAWPDGSVDVIDYKRARGPSARPYAFQLSVYALAAREIFPGAPRIRRGIIFLGGTSAEPAWLEDADLGAFRASMVELGARFVEARFREEFRPVAAPACRAIDCGFMPLCHPA